jgi:hypothetical protein
MNLSSDTLSDEIEPSLLRCGFVVRSSRGRQVTPEGYDHLKLVQRSTQRWTDSTLLTENGGQKIGKYFVCWIATFSSNEFLAPFSLDHFRLDLIFLSAIFLSSTEPSPFALPA